MTKTIVDYIMERVAAGDPDAVRAIKKVLINNALMVLTTSEDGSPFGTHWVHRTDIVRLANELASKQDLKTSVSEEEVIEFMDSRVKGGSFSVRKGHLYRWSIHDIQ